MEKSSQRHLMGDEQDQIGCMWVFISLFDVRNGGSTQKLLADKKRGSRRISGAGPLRNKLDRSTCSDDNYQEIIDGEGRNAASDVGKPSVKKLIEEEMFTEQEPEKDINNGKVEKLTVSGCEGSKKKNRQRKNKTRCKSHDNINPLNATDNLDTEGHNDSDHKSASSLTKSTSCVKHDQPGEVSFQSNQTNDGYRQTMSDLIKLLESEKDGEIHTHQDLLEEFQIWDSDEESYLKPSHELDSLLLKYVQDLPHSQIVKEENFKSVEKSLSSEQVSAAEQSNMVVSCKRRSFFKRKAKSKERSCCIENTPSQVSNRIVVLKPGPTNLDMGSSSTPHSMTQNKGQNEKISSHFSLTGIKRKLKSAIGKEPREIPVGGISKRFSDNSQNTENEEVKENVDRNVSNKDHVFSERMSRASTSEKNGQETHESESAKKNASDIYIEAKKHLSDMLRNGDRDMNLSSKQVPNILGKVLSLPEYFSPVSSPKSNQEQNFVNVNDNKQECNLSLLGQTAERPKTQKCNSDDGSSSTVESLVLGSNEQLTNENHEKLEETLSTSDEMSSGDLLETVKDAEIIEQVKHAVSSEPCSSSNTKSEPNEDDAPEMHDEKGDNELLKQEAFDVTQSPTSPVGSPPNSSIRRAECQESVTDIPGRTSPVSVLEPLFTEDDISPTNTRSHSVEIRMQPLCIKFDTVDNDQDNNIKTTMDDKESTFEYIKAMVKTSSLDWENLYMKSLSSDQLLKLSLIDEIEFFPNQFCYDQKLLFDCINEVLMEFRGHEFGCSPWVSFVKPTVQPISNMESIIHEVQEGVQWHLLPLPFPHTLDQIVRKDMAKYGKWMDIRYDVDCIGTETGEAILDELLEEIALNCINLRPKMEYSLLLTESKKEETSINL